MARKREVLANENISHLPPPSGRHPMSGEPFWAQAAVEALSDQVVKPRMHNARELAEEYGMSLAETISYLLPHWAVGFNEKCEPKVGSMLVTRNGFRTGNAHIIGIVEDELGTYYQVLTDAGNEITYNEKELRGGFFISQFISDINEVKRKFGPREPDQVMDGLAEAMAHLRTLAKSGATADQMRELATKAIERVNKKVGANYVG